MKMLFFVCVNCNNKRFLTRSSLRSINDKLRLLANYCLLQAPPGQDHFVCVRECWDCVAQEWGIRKSYIRPVQMDIMVAWKQLNLFNSILLVSIYYSVRVIFINILIAFHIFFLILLIWEVGEYSDLKLWFFFNKEREMSFKLPRRKILLFNNTILLFMKKWKILHHTWLAGNESSIKTKTTAYFLCTFLPGDKSNHHLSIIVWEGHR